MRTKLFVTTLIVLLGIALSVAMVNAQGPAPRAPGAAMGTAFTYQGQLKKSGSPVTSTCTFTFGLWDAASGGTQLGSNQTVSGVSVSNGLFTTQVNGGGQFGANAFTGDARWLQISAQCSGDVSPTSLGRQELTATPYALTLRPGATIQNTGTALNLKATTGSGYGVYVQNTSAGSGFEEPTAIQGEANSVNGIAIAGVNSNGRGILGQGTGRYGVGGFSDTSYGTYGKSTSGPGVQGEGYYTGTVGTATATTAKSFGVLGESNSTTNYSAGGRFVARGLSGETYGIYGLTYSGSSNASGVYGYSSTGSTNGVWGETNSDSSSSAAVFGYASFSGGAAVPLWARSDGTGDLIRAYSPGGLRFKVDNVGNVSADGTYSTPAADFAEMLPAVNGLEAGDVLAIGLDGKLTRSNAAYASTVAGIYSTKPGFVGGSGDGIDPTGKIPLAIVGIVPVKASAENGAIQPGDLLVAASIPGHAMKAGVNPPVGTVIGKAFGSLQGGTGVVQMLVTLQ